MSDYTLIARKVVYQTSWDDTYGADSAVANAILEDGSFFFAAWLDTSWSEGGQYIGMWRVGADGTLLGSSRVMVPLVGSFVGGTNSVWPQPYAVAVSGMKVLMVSGTVWDDTYRNPGTGHRAFASWMVDCSGNAPVAGPQIPMPTAFAGKGLGYLFWAFPVYSVYDKATDRVILATHNFDFVHSYGHHPITMVQVFRGSTGDLLSEASTGRPFSFPTGLYMDPTNPTKFTVCATDQDTYVQAYNLAFTISMDGLSASFDGSTTTYTSASGYQQAIGGGSPYIAGGGGVLTTDYLDPYSISGNNEWLVYANATGVVASFSEGPYIFMNYLSQSSVSTAGGRDIVAFFEAEDNDPTGPPPHDRNWYFGRLVVVNQSADPVVIEIIDLDYGLNIGLYPNRPPSFDYSTPVITVDEGTGIILISVLIYSYFAYRPYLYNETVMCWIIQGPTAEKPNLNGGPIGVDVRFSRPGGGLL